MPNYIFTYHQPRGYTVGSDSEATAAWQRFFEGIASSVVEVGQPVLNRSTVGEVGATTQLGGYSVIRAADLDQALALAKGCPSIECGGGVQVGELAELPPDHIVERLRDRASQSRA